MDNMFRFMGDGVDDRIEGSGGIEEDEGVVFADFVADVDGFGEAEEGAVGVEGGCGANVDC
jgi:hypothetical protein